MRVITKEIDTKMELSKQLVDAVNFRIRKESREEAKLILSLTTDKYRNEFIEYHEKENGNICCLVLDFAKKDLVKQGKMKQNTEDSFGGNLI